MVHNVPGIFSVLCKNNYVLEVAMFLTCNCIELCHVNMSSFLDCQPLMSRSPVFEIVCSFLGQPRAGKNSILKIFTDYVCQEHMSGSSCRCKGTEFCVSSMKILYTFELRDPPFSLPGSMRVYDKIRVIFLREALVGNFSHMVNLFCSSRDWALPALLQLVEGDQTSQEDGLGSV